MRIDQLKPQLIIVMGGAGSGKNYYIKNDPVASSYRLIDVDAIKGEMGLDAAIGAIKPMLQGAFNEGENVAHPTTGSNLKGQQNKIALAREYDYKVTIVLVDTPIEQAIAQVRKRYREGGHDVEIDAIVNSNKKARENFEALKGLADDAIVVGRSSVNEDIAAPISFKVASPNQFSPSEINAIAKVIQSEGQVDSAGLISRIKRAKLFCVAIDADKIVGVSAIKIPDESYHEACFEKAGLIDQISKYPYEMGWKVVLPAYRGKDLGTQMSNELFTKINKQQIFATVRADNMASITPLTRMGFKPAGKPYFGATGNKIVLFTVSGQVNESPLQLIQDPKQAKQYQKMFNTRNDDNPITGKHEFMGSGSEAVVVRSTNEPSIIKIVGTSTNLKRCGTLQYLLHCKKHAHSNPYLPRVHSIQEFKDTRSEQTEGYQYPANGQRNFFVIQMEELISLYDVDDNPEMITALCEKAFPGANLTEISAQVFADLIYWAAGDPSVLNTRFGITVIDAQLQQAIRLIKLVKRQTGAQSDLHFENVMVRVGPTGPCPVLSDPLVNESNIGW